MFLKSFLKEHISVCLSKQRETQQMLPRLIAKLAVLVKCSFLLLLTSYFSELLQINTTIFYAIMLVHQDVICKALEVNLGFREHNPSTSLSKLCVLMILPMCGIC